MDFKNATILLPAMDETYSLEQTVDTVYKTCHREDLAEFIIILSPKSTKACRETAEKLVAKYADTVRIYIHDQKRPFVGGACQDGFDLAVGSHVVLMSSDLETDPKLVRKFIANAKKHPDCITTASRWIGGGSFEGYNKIKLVCNKIFEKMIAILFHVRLSDLTYGYRIFPAELMKKIHWEEMKHPFFLETALKPLRLGVRFREVPAHWKARTEGQSVNGFWANFKYFRTAWHVRWMDRRKIMIEGENS